VFDESGKGALFARLIGKTRAIQAIRATASNGFNWQRRLDGPWREINMRGIMPNKQKTAALYARFSSDLQNDRSIDDQLAICRQYAAREGFKITREFSDRAKTSATLFDRDGFLELMHEAKARKFDVVIVESLDRVSRDPEDLAGIFKRLKFAQVDRHTLNEGIADDMKVGFRGMMGAAFLKDLAAKVRRHHVGRVREGHVMGTVSYGYRSVRGKPGEREINPEEADIVRRIFREYADCVSPAGIALALTHEKIPAPNGGETWSHQTFLGGGGKAGMLGNRLYIGELVYNQRHTVRNPDSGAVVTRANPERDHVRKDVPHMRIIDQKLWDAAQAIRSGRAFKRFGTTGLKIRSATARRGDHLLSGLLRCGQCHGHMIFTSTSRGRQFVACAAARNKSACSHRKSYDVDLLKQLVVTNFRENLIDPEAHAKAMKAAHAEYAALAKKNSGEKIAAEKQITRLSVQITRLVDAIENSDKPIKELVASIEAKEAERVGLIERVRLLGASNVVTLHPHVLDAYRENIEKLHTALTGSADVVDPEIIAAFRNVMDSIVVVPTAYREPYMVDAYGRLSAIMGTDLFPTRRSGEEIIAAEGVSPAVMHATDRGQVQRGNTWPQLHQQSVGVLFMAGDAS
jgi:site-specific DNA recombinase